MLLALKAICRSEDGRTSSCSVERGAVAGIVGASRLGSTGRSGPGSCDSAVAQWLDERADRARLRGDAGWHAALAQLVLAIGVDGLRASDRPGREAVKSEAAARVVASLLTLSTADRPNWTLPRLQAEIARQGEDTIFEVAARQDVKKWLAMASAPPWPCRAARPGRRRPRRAAAQAPVAAGRGRRHRATVTGRV